MISKELSKTLYASNVIATILVVSIHYSEHSSFSSDTEFFSRVNFYIQEFIVDGIARSAVPLFAILAGFFAYSSYIKRASFLLLLKSKIKSLLVPYMLCSLVICVYYFFFITNTDNFNLSYYVSRWLFKPFSIQFWFLRDLIFLTLFIPILFFNNKFFKALLGIILFLSWLFEIQVTPKFYGWYLLSIETLFYFWLGGFLCQYRSQLVKLASERYEMLLYLHIIWIGLILSRIFIDPTINIWYQEDYSGMSLLLYKASIIFGIIALIHLGWKVRMITAVQFLAGFSFFVYIFHMHPVISLKGILGAVIAKEVMFYILVPLGITVCYSAALIISYFIPLVFNLLTGGRSPTRVTKSVSELN